MCVPSPIAPALGGASNPSAVSQLGNESAYSKRLVSQEGVNDLAMLLDAVNRVQYLEEEVDDMCRSPKRPKLEIVDSCASGPPEKEGSVSLIQSLQWASRIVDELFPEERNRLALWFRTGCLVKSNYSGIGCAELAFANLQKALKRKLGDGVWVPPICLVECADTDKQCRQVLQAQGPPCTTPERCFGDI